jgi:CubicO group peptidase (beta-lactamase class C family)
MKKARNTFAAALAALILISIPAGAQDLKKVDEAFRAFDRFYLDGLKSYGIYGSSFVFVGDNMVLDRHSYGMAHIANGYPVDEDTIYHWASITKTLTGIAIMQLRDRGRLKLDDPITKYVPELRLAHNEFGSMDEITIAMLLSHTAGAGTSPGTRRNPRNGTNSSR